MKIPLAYIVRNLWTRRLTTMLTAGGMALVVFVFAAVLMLEEGLHKTLVQTGSWDNAVMIRRSSGTEVQSIIDRNQAAVIASAPEIAYGADGEPIVSKEVVVLINLEKRASAKPSNVIIRGVGAKGLALRPQVTLTEGRMFRPGSSEIIAGRAIAQRFSGTGLHETLRFGGCEWTVVGVFDAGGSGFDSEIWGDADQMMQAFRRNAYSVTVAKLVAADRFPAFRARLEADPRLTVEAKRETVFYAEQSEMLANFIRILGMTLSVIFSFGAIIGAMITMYAAVANRTAEIGTLRALGFQRRSILAAFLVEALFLSLLGGALGLVLASLMQLVSVSTMNWQSFAEIAFRFSLTPRIVIQSLAFAAFMGLLGGVLPAARAARLKIVDALRAA
ncbi:MAG: FtsX-like permease family protein [Burkholderiales bacterium]|nr:FtsX-like permease family protein [Burkholderiales bacterium]